MTEIEIALADPLVRETLAKAGWSPTRRVSIEEWFRWFNVDGYTSTTAAVQILESFGGLVIRPPRNEAADFGSGLIEFDPIAAAAGESDRVHYRERQLGELLCPIGEWCEVYLLLLGASGAVYAEAPEYGMLVLGPTFGTALRCLITGIGKPREVLGPE